QRPDRLSQAMDTEVIIVGAGPVGLTLAIDLGRRGVNCILLEQKDAPQFLPKMERCNARTMEIYRRLGIAESIRNAGFPRDAPMDVFIVTSLVEPPLLHLPYPSVAQARAEIAACNDGSMPVQPAPTAGCGRSLINSSLSIHSSRCLSRSQRACRASMSATAVNLFRSNRTVGAWARRSNAAKQHWNCALNISSAATVVRAMCVASSASIFRVRPICCNCGRRFIVATICSTASRSAKGGIITLPM